LQTFRHRFSIYVSSSVALVL